MLSITTDYANVDRGDPSPYLRRIADAGFSHVHWCHHWNSDFIYSQAEIEQIGRWLADYGLALLDLHSSVGPEKHWFSAREYERQAGVELVKNRIAMAAQLGSDVIIMHYPKERDNQPIRRSLDELADYARRYGVRIALENGSFDALEALLAEYPADCVGVCYDSGHGNLTPDGLDRLARSKDRLISVHLHDNDGTADQHNLIFSGTVDWPRLAQIIAQSAYRKPISSESNMGRSGITDEAIFLARAFAAGTQFAAMVEAARGRP